MSCVTLWTVTKVINLYSLILGGCRIVGKTKDNWTWTNWGWNNNSEWHRLVNWSFKGMTLITRAFYVNCFSKLVWSWLKRFFHFLMQTLPRRGSHRTVRVQVNIKERPIAKKAEGKSMLPSSLQVYNICIVSYLDIWKNYKQVQKYDGNYKNTCFFFYQKCVEVKQYFWR